MRTLLVSILLVLSSSALADESIFPSKEQLKAAEQLSPGAMSRENRSFLKGKMKHHNKDAKDLAIAVATVNLAEVQRLAQSLANAPRLDRAAGAASQLPDRFFELQDELKTTSQKLADAARATDANAVLGQYKLLVTTCMNCHLSFKAQVEGQK